MNTVTPLMELERQLLEDRDGSVRATLLERLRSIQARLVVQRRNLASPLRQRQLAGAQQAVEAAIEVLGRANARPP
ncbi:hypothetical protein [Variovorax sp. KK3]|uniref:hypothetical protein n=1 Tax=Variovorax sp. KK3 TaxID=1855728 RepID=UPI00097C9912|nr:hypothetical protein [Variovorax sp. KK3]